MTIKKLSLIALLPALVSGLMLVVISSLGRSPVHQIRADEMCVNYECYKGTVCLSIRKLTDGTQELNLTRSGKTLTVIVVAEVFTSGRSFFKFIADRGFLSVGQYDQNAFIYLDGEHITLHITHSTFRPQDR